MAVARKNGVISEGGGREWEVSGAEGKKKRNTRLGLKSEEGKTSFLLMEKCAK